MRQFILSFMCVLAGVFVTPAFAQSNDPCADYVPQPKPQNVGRDIVGQELAQIMYGG